jgi:proteasome lid subunit RPN8/RPN11
MKIIRAFRGRRALVRFSRPQWAALLAELERRGQRRRESGAFLLTPRKGDGKTVTSIVYFDDLDPDCLVGHIHLRASAFGKLWSICEQRGERVLADIHTHPHDWVAQSETDQDNPMIAKAGHLALIAPRYAQGTIATCDVGAHRYVGDAGWESWRGREAAHRIYVGRWP